MVCSFGRHPVTDARPLRFDSHGPDAHVLAHLEPSSHTLIPGGDTGLTFRAPGTAPPPPSFPCRLGLGELVTWRSGTDGHYHHSLPTLGPAIGAWRFLAPLCMSTTSSTGVWSPNARLPPPPAAARRQQTVDAMSAPVPGDSPSGHDAGIQNFDVRVADSRRGLPAWEKGKWPLYALLHSSSEPASAASLPSFWACDRHQHEN